MVRSPSTLPEDLRGDARGRRGAAASAGEVHIGRQRRGATFGRLVMLDLLGGGGMGGVFLCYDPELGRRVLSPR